MHVAAVETDHPEVRRIQPTWHCVLRFRQRAAAGPGADLVAEALRAVLAEADVTRVPPPWATGERGAARWAVSGPFAFPLADGGGSTWLALTCLAR